MAHDDRTDPRCDADALVVRARTDRESFGKLYDLYYDRIYRYCVRRLYHRCGAEEGCADTFLYVAAHMPQFRGTTEREFRCWLYAVATNTVNSHVRRTRRRGELIQQAIERGKLRSVSTNDSPRSTGAPDWNECYQAINQLRVREQSIVILRFIEELSHEEIAATLRMSPGAVRVALSRAIEKLRKQLLPPEKPFPTSRER